MEVAKNYYLNTNPLHDFHVKFQVKEKKADGGEDFETELPIPTKINSTFKAVFIEGILAPTLRIKL